MKTTHKALGSLVVWISLGAVLGLVWARLNPAKEIRTFSIQAPLIPRVTSSNEEKGWLGESAIDPLELADAVKRNFGKSTNSEVYVSEVSWRKFMNDQYLLLTVRSTGLPSGSALVGELLIYLNAQYGPHTKGLLDKRKHQFEKLETYRNKLQLRMDALLKKQGPSVAEDAIAELLLARIDVLNQQIEFQTEALDIQGTGEFKQVALENGQLVGNYPNWGLFAIMGAILGLVLGIVFHLGFASSTKQLAEASH